MVRKQIVFFLQLGFLGLKLGDLTTITKVKIPFSNKNILCKQEEKGMALVAPHFGEI